MDTKLPLNPQSFQRLSVNMRQAAELTGMSRSRLYELLKEDKLTAVAEGRSTKVLYQSLIDYISGLPTKQFGLNNGDKDPE